MAACLPALRRTEYAALCTLRPKVSVPLPVGQNRNAVVMALIPAGPHPVPAIDPAATLDEILANVRAAYRAGVIHADLSEFNILMEDNRCVLIDWPQWMETSHPNAAPSSSVISTISSPSL